MGNNEVLKVEKSNWLPEDEKKIIQKQFFPQGASVMEMQYCMKVAEKFNLNPILKQIYFVPRRTQVNGQWIDKVEPLAGRDSFLTLAHRSGKFAGIESKVEIKDTPVLKDGKWTRENDLVATATVFRLDTDKPFIVSVNHREYVQKTKQGQPTKFWNDKPETMLKKVAESQALRKAFDITGLYAEEEYEDKYINYELGQNESKKENQQTNKLNDMLSVPVQTATTQTPKEEPVEIEIPETQTETQQMKDALIKKGVTVEKAEDWCMRNAEVIELHLKEASLIDRVAEDLMF